MNLRWKSVDALTVWPRAKDLHSSDNQAMPLGAADTSAADTAESYLMDHDVVRCAVFGVDTIDGLASVFPSMSLKKHGRLDKPYCRMLLVNGKDDVQTPIADLYILLEYDGPKSARVFQADTWARLYKPCRL